MTSVKGLKIASGLTLPLETVTQAIGILAKRRAGKSYCARRFAEQLFGAGQQIVVVDPKGDWHGLRSSADGKKPGLAVIILGGEHGDIPLEVSSGEVVARLVVEERVSVLLDLSQFRKHEVATFMTAFLENLYRLKAKESFRTPVMLFIDEADAIAPQKPQKGAERMLGAAEDIVRRGGQRGIGCTLITQRSAVLNKNVLTQVGMMVALRTIAPQDIAAMKAWIDVHGTIEQQSVLMESLPSLPVGDAWFWAPGWPEADGIFKRAHVYPIETFDSGATPKPGEKRVEPKKAADVDLDALRRQMKATVERAEANDPAKLKKRITDLEGQLSAKVKGQPVQQVVKCDHEKQIKLLATDAARWKKFAERAGELLLGQIAAVTRVYELSQQAHKDRPAIIKLNEEFKVIMANPLMMVDLPSGQVTRLPNKASDRPVVPQSPRPPVVEPRGDISRPQQRILDALSELSGVGLERPNRSIVAAMSNQSPKSSGFDKNVSTLRTLGLIEYAGPGLLILTRDGLRAAQLIPNKFTTMGELHNKWKQFLSGPQGRMLDVIIEAGWGAVDRETLATKSGQSITSSGFDKNVSTLKSFGLIEYPRGGFIQATDLLFPEGLK